MSSKKKVGIHDVASAAGVSTATVSQVYNNKGEVAAATRERVLEVGARLGYRPNAIGQALRSGRSRVIGIVVSYRDSAVWEQTYMPYYRSIIAGAAIEAVEHGYSISAAASTADGHLDTYLPLDGIIVVDPLPGDPLVELSLQNGMAVVTDGGYRTTAEGRLATVRTEMEAAIPAVLSAMLAESAEPDSAGRDSAGSDSTGRAFRPALFVGPRLDDYTGSTTAAYRAWCQANGCPEQVLTLGHGQSPLDAARELLSRGAHEVTAVHCLNDTYCTAITAAAAELGIEIPTELQVSVMGNAAAVAADPRVLYLNVDPVVTGAVCARTLIELLEGESPGTVVQPVPLARGRQFSPSR